MTQPLEIIRQYAEKQSLLVRELIANSPNDVNEFNLKYKTPSEVDAFGVSWRVIPHGVGIQFNNCQNGEVVDVHEGLFDAPDAFDAWRIEEFSNSLKTLEKIDWPVVLSDLEVRGDIAAHPNYRNHFVLV